jgi:hypothetical protein
MFRESAMATYYRTHVRARRWANILLCQMPNHIQASTCLLLRCVVGPRAVELFLYLLDTQFLR